MASLEVTRAVVEEGETYDGKIIPEKKSEINRPVRLHPNSRVQGGVYGETVEITEATATGSVMAADAIEIDAGEVQGEVGSPGKVTGTDCTVYGTVTGKRVRLTDSVVYGNVVGQSVILEDCLVVGTVSTDRKLVLENTLCYTFTAEGETTVDGGSIVLPQAEVEGSITFQTPLTVTGLGELDANDADMPALDDGDLVRVDGTTNVTLAPRILNLEKVTDRLEELEAALQEVVATTDKDDVPPASELFETLGVEGGPTDL
jgi:hypothetical protein